MTKIALLSDIHGNTTALEAVLEDSRKAKVDEYWLLGDSLMPGNRETGPLGAVRGATDYGQSPWKLGR